MNLPALCIQRPAFTIVISLVMTIMGLIGFMNLPVRWIPNVNPPQISIDTSYPGANAYLMEHDVTKVIEEALSGISGIETLTSTSRQNESSVSVTFKLGRNMDAAVEDVRSSLERLRGSLPREVKNPIVSKADPNNEAIMYISFSDDHRNAREMSDYIDKYIAPLFDTMDGVGRVEVYGKRVSAMQVKLDPAKMAGANITVDEVTQSLQDQNASIPSGQIRGADRYYSVVTDTSLKSAEQFNDLILRNNQNQIVRLKDIGSASLQAENEDSAFRINGKSGIALGIVPQSMANPLDVESEVKKKFAALKKTLPAGMEANIIYNQADYIRASIHSVYESFIEAVIFVWLVIFAFLCSFRATLIPLITIPVCLMSTFALLYFLNFSINTITLMALVLAIGLVVDDAIVMLENISRHMETGLSNKAAAIRGSREIILPIVAMTLTLAAVYAPIAFTSGLLGVLFREFTFTLAGAVLISGIVALTLSPMMCARLLQPSDKINRYQQWLTKKIQILQNQYRSLLTFLLVKRKWVLLFLLLVGSIGIAVCRFIPHELAPQEDMGAINVSVAAPRSASFLYTDIYARQLEKMYDTVPDIASYLTVTGTYSVSHAWQMLNLKPSHERKHSITDIVDLLTAKSQVISGVKVNVFKPPPPLAEFAGGDEGDNIGLVIMTSSDYRHLQQATQGLITALRKIPDFIRVDNGLKWDSTQFQINIDRERASDLKVPMSAITNTISTFMAGKNVGKMDDANIIVQMQKTGLSNPNIFQELYVRNTEGKMQSLSALLSVNEVTTPEVFRHTERLRSDTIYLSLAPKVKIGDAIKTLQAVAKATLPEDMKYTFTGEAKSFLDSTGKTFITFFLAIIFIYLVLVAQFESFVDPFIILFTVPFAVVGAILTLKIFGGTFNIYSNIGMITLIGLIAKHGILITEFANQLRLKGISIHEAVIQASVLRLRPILMTTAAMVLGALPLAFAFGAGAESRQQIGLVIAGGLLFGTVFSLVVIPIAYTYLTPSHKG